MKIYVNSYYYKRFNSNQKVISSIRSRILNITGIKPINSNAKGNVTIEYDIKYNFLMATHIDYLHKYESI